MRHRLYVFTGKGGVGKSSVSLAFAKSLQLRGQKVLFYAFGSSRSELAEELGVDCLNLSLKQSAEEYIARKLNSKKIAKWVLKSAFFSSFLDVLPGLQQVILLGHLIDLLEKDAELSIVVDGPSSGHALTLFEAGYNFKKIFKTGLLFSDIERIHRFLYGKGRMKVFIVVRPSSMAVCEGKELSEKLAGFQISSRYIVLNDVISQEKFSNEQLPEFLKKKIELEALAIEELKGEFVDVVFPHYPLLEDEKIIQEMLPLAAKL